MLYVVLLGIQLVLAVSELVAGNYNKSIYWLGASLIVYSIWKL